MVADAVQPGWRPDPRRPGTERWWNGLGWSDAYRPAGGVAPARSSADLLAAAKRDAGEAASRVQSTVRDAAAERARAAPLAAAGAVAAVNPVAGAAVILGVLGLIVGAYGVLPLVGLVVSLTGLARSRRLARDGARRTGFGQSMTGLVLSVLGLLRWVPALVELLRGLDVRFS